MSETGSATLRRWHFAVPLLGAVAAAVSFGSHPPTPILIAAGILLVTAVLSAVHHAEVVAHRVGEPLGSLVLAVAVTVIEVALIVTLMTSGDPEKTATLARDTVFAAVMITTTVIVGLAVTIGAWRQQIATFNAEGSATMLATVATLAALCLVVPRFTTSEAGPEFSGSQLVFAAVAALLLYLTFVFVQTIRHRDFFVPPEAAHSEDAHAAPPDTRTTAISGLLLLASLVAVVGLAKLESEPIEDMVSAVGAPHSAVGVVIALLVLLPEGLAAARNAARGRVQTSLNLAYGSAMASIGLTIPVIALASIWLDGPLLLGLDPLQIALLTITVAVSALTLLPGRATVQEGAVHLVLGAAFVFLAFRP